MLRDADFRVRIPAPLLERLNAYIAQDTNGFSKNTLMLVLLNKFLDEQKEKK
jgi:hypothetical protein